MNKLNKKKILLVFLATVIMFLTANLFLILVNIQEFMPSDLPTSFEISENTRLINDGGTASYLTYGPYANVEEGKSEIIVYYSTDSDNNRVDVYSNSLQQTYLCETLYDENNMIVLEVDLTEDVNDLEVRTWYCGEDYLSIEKIVIKSEISSKEILAVNIISGIFVLCALAIWCLRVKICNKPWLKYFVAATVEFSVICVFTSAVIYANGYDIFSTEIWTHYDSFLYLSIAESGYNYYPIEYDGVLTMDGNTGWFPLYPFLVKVLNFITGSTLGCAKCGVIISFIFAFLIVLLLEAKFLKVSSNSFLTVLSIFFFPGAIYLFAVFPMSITIFFILANLYFLLQKKYLYSGIAGFFASMCYSTAFLIAVVDGLIIIYDFFTDHKDIKRSVKEFVLSPIITFMGFIATMIIIYIASGDPMAFFVVQGHYGHGLHNPFNTIASLLNYSENVGSQVFIGHHSLGVLAFIYILIFTYIFVIKKYYKDREKTIFYAVAFVYFAFMTIMGVGVSPYRQFLIMSLSFLALKDEKTVNKVLLLIPLILYNVRMIEMFIFNISV